MEDNKISDSQYIEPCPTTMTANVPYSYEPPSYESIMSGTGTYSSCVNGQGSPIPKPSQEYPPHILLVEESPHPPRETQSYPSTGTQSYPLPTSETLNYPAPSTGTQHYLLQSSGPQNYPYLQPGIPSNPQASTSFSLQSILQPSPTRAVQVVSEGRHKKKYFVTDLETDKGYFVKERTSRKGHCSKTIIKEIRGPKTIVKETPRKIVVHQKRH